MMMTPGPARLAVRLLALALVPLALSLAGCGKKKIENACEPASLAQAVSGESTNKLFKFELNSPTILAIGNIPRFTNGSLEIIVRPLAQLFGIIQDLADYLTARFWIFP